jgi:hypothetical protein
MTTTTDKFNKVAGQEPERSNETLHIPEKPYVKNCFLYRRESDATSCLFYGKDEDEIKPYLDGYAIIPIEDYKAMKAELAEYESKDKYSLKA